MQFIVKLQLVIIAMAIFSAPLQHGWLSYLADLFLGIAFIVTLYRNLLNIRAESNLKNSIELPSTPMICFLLFMFLSGIFTGSKNLQECFQYAGLFLVGYIGVRGLVARVKPYLNLVTTIQVITFIIISIGFAALFSSKVPLPFKNQHLYCAFLVLTIPLLQSATLCHSYRVFRILALLALPMALLSISTAYTFIVIFIEIVFFAMLHNRNYGLLIALGLVITISIGNTFLPRNQSQLEMLSSSIYPLHTVNVSSEDKGVLLRTRYAQWWASLNIMQEYPLWGTGPGSFQENIGSYYGSVPKPNENDLEPNTNNMFAVIGTTMGIPALIFLILAFLYSAAEASEPNPRVQPSINTFRRGLAIGLFAILPVSLFVMPFVKGLGAIIAIMLAMTAAPLNDNKVTQGASTGDPT